MKRWLHLRAAGEVARVKRWLVSPIDNLPALAEVTRG